MWRAVYLLGLCLSAPIVHAEITTDGSLGINTVLEGPDYVIPATLGQQVGNNLFHSFHAFNLNKAQSATFNGVDTIANIITRVTGDTSIIDGRIISAIPDSNFYLINPAGMIFGPNAQFDIDGSLHLSTASSLYLGEQGEFNSLDPDVSVLSSAPPTAFGFLSASPASLAIDRGSLATGAGKTLSLSGGNIAISQGQLAASVGRINLAAVKQATRIENLEDEWQIDADAQLGSIELQQDSSIDTGKEGQGDVSIQADQLLLQDSEILINAGVNDGGQLNINVNNLVLDNAQIDSRTLDIGKGSDFNIRVNGNMLLRNSSIRSVSLDIVNDTDEALRAGDAGNIIIQTNNLTISNSTISTNTSGNGQGGDIHIEVTANLIIEADSTIQARSEGSVSNAGDAGRIQISSHNLTLQGSSQIDDSTEGSGAAGSIDIEVCEQLQLSDGAAISSDSQGIGQAGSIHIRAHDMHLSFARISTETNQSNGGNVIARVKDTLSLDTSELSATVNGGEGNGGNLFISNPRSIQLRDSKVIANARGGDGGLILLVTGQSLQNVGSEITASSETGVDGSVQIDFPVDINTLPIIFLDASNLIKQQCGVRSDEEVSSFLVYPSLRGLPHAPHDLQPHLPTWVE